jgi:hypothetical protein
MLSGVGKFQSTPCHVAVNSRCVVAVDDGGFAVVVVVVDDGPGRSCGGGL